MSDIDYVLQSVDLTSGCQSSSLVRSVLSIQALWVNCFSLADITIACGWFHIPVLIDLIRNLRSRKIFFCRLLCPLLIYLLNELREEYERWYGPTRYSSSSWPLAWLRLLCKVACDSADRYKCGGLLSTADFSSTLTGIGPIVAVWRHFLIICSNVIYYGFLTF